MNFHPIVVFDFETDGTDPNTCNPVQLAAIVIEPRTLNIITDSEFCTYIKPDEINNDSYYNDHKDTIDWHANNMKITAAKVIDKWKAAPSEKNVWSDFKDYLLRYHKQDRRKSKFSAPIAAGANILRFDLIIIERLSVKYGDLDKDNNIKVFYPRDKIDTMLWCFAWFENLEEPLKYNMNYLRNFFGMSTKGSHDALKDVNDTAQLVIKFLKLHRAYSSQVKFKNAFGK